MGTEKRKKIIVNNIDKVWFRPIHHLLYLQNVTATHTPTSVISILLCTMQLEKQVEEFVMIANTTQPVDSAKHASPCTTEIRSRISSILQFANVSISFYFNSFNLFLWAFELLFARPSEHTQKTIIVPTQSSFSVLECTKTKRRFCLLHEKLK